MMTVIPSTSIATGIGTAGGGVSSGATRGASNAGSAGEVFQSTLEGVADSLSQADELSQQVATGELADLSQLTAAAAKAELGVQMTVAFRDRAVESFQQIMNMQI